LQITGLVFNLQSLIVSYCDIAAITELPTSGNMKPIRLLILFVLFFVAARAQTPTDKLYKIVRTSKIDSDRTNAAMNIMLMAAYLPPDSILYYAEKIRAIGLETHFPKAEALGLAGRGYALVVLGSRASGLEYALRALKIAEEDADSRVLSMVYTVLGVCYPDNAPKSLEYTFKALKMVNNGVEREEKSIIIGNIGFTFLRKGQPDSALKYQQQNYELLVRKNKVWNKSFIATSLVFALTDLGGTHLLLGNIELAATYFKLALKATRTFNSDRNKVVAYGGMVSLFAKTGLADSAFFYNRKIMDLAMHNKMDGWKVGPADLLYKYFKSRKQTDSALKYLAVYTVAKARVDSNKQETKVQTLSFEEDIRQKELSVERKQNLQYAAIAVGLVGFILLFLLLSRSIITSSKVIRFFGIIALLIAFEFINLFLHPFLEDVTDHSPILMLLALVCIAALLVPAHHQLEKWMTRTMVEKNKRIRLEAAKKTIAQLENDGK